MMKKIIMFISGLTLACSLPLGVAANTKHDAGSKYLSIGTNATYENKNQEE